ncbi:AMP-binding domain protein [Isoalcanivorax pacificus W11-5]|uniref:AMP-binding domain protein n=1 Tax=Isoalcanivorax pacificus W11-5 TaxID=391936 RepID=A0A0B4XMD3_9GAMM|nr:acyl-CoA synthetase [Isoalcanivorax pacificus]AJD47487.1 AMP-binding domain protein [Isoalcanivorax pacificus W11-5]
MSAASGISSLADVTTREQAVDSLALPDSTYAMIRQGHDLAPDAPALSFFLQTASHRRPQTWTYRALLGRIHQTANFFHSLGADKNTVIAYVLPNLPETHLTIWGGEATGIVCAINPLLEAPAIAELLNAAGATVLVTLAPFPGTDLWPKVQRAIQEVPGLRHLVLLNIADHVHGLKGKVAGLLQKREAVGLHGLGGVRRAIPRRIALHDFNRARRRQPGSHLRSRRIIHRDDIASYFCTGGTTGTPKLAMRRHRNEVANVWSAAQFLGDGVGTGKNLFCGLPLFHVNAVLVTGRLPFSLGAHVVLGTPQGYRGDGVVKRFWEIVEHHQIHFFSGVPTLYSALLQVPVGQHRIDSLEYGLCGAAPMPVEVFRTFEERTGLKILEGYGLTEGTCVSSVNPPLGEQRLGSIGLRIPGQPMKAVILDDEGRYQRDCGVNEVGIIVIRGPNVFAGYKVAEHNKGLWIDDDDGERWLNTGDLGRQDADGYFWLTGRKKELIIRGGHNIDPASIEEPLHRHPAVEVAAAVGRPDLHAGEVPVAYVQLRAGATATAEALMTFARNEINERAAQPKAIRIIDEMPLTGVGKIFKPELRHREIAETLRAALQDAGITVRALTVENHKVHGTAVNITLPAHTATEQAERILGQFPFFCTLTTAATDT